MESCIMCYNPTRTKVNARDKSLVRDIVATLADQRIPHTYLIGGEPTYGYTGAELSDMVDQLADNGSSTTIVTNGQIHLKHFNNRLAAFGVSIHGADAESHDSITGKRGSFKRALDAVRLYVEDGHDVRFVTVIMGRNHDQMYRIAELAYELGAESIYFDVYEPGGIGESLSRARDLRMQPTAAELRVALGEVIRAHDELPFRGDVGLGTALPFCFDERLIRAGMVSDCGAGTWFTAVTSTGDLRLCNQSRSVFGNVLRRPVAEIWTDPLIDLCYRNLSWVSEPCSSCELLEMCGGGCRVDEGCPSGELCIDRVVRENGRQIQRPMTLAEVRPRRVRPAASPELRRLRVSPWLDTTELYADRGDLFFKTRYQTVRVERPTLNIVKSIMRSGPSITEEALIESFADVVARDSMRDLVTDLISSGAVECV
jgi:pyrroloquinoline quinone biosynthesis protein E